MLCSLGMDEEFGLAVISQTHDSLAGMVRAKINRILEDQMAQAVREITGHREKLDRLVDVLLRQNSLQREGIDKVLSDSYTDANADAANTENM